jgi:hypothetical protein
MIGKVDCWTRQIKVETPQEKEQYWPYVCTNMSHKALEQDFANYL